MKYWKLFSSVPIFLVVLMLALPANLSAHCDGIDGPVVKAAQKALEEKNVKLVLIWIKEENQKEIIDLFNKTLKVRGINREAQEIADRFFFETVVRIHRAGEGAPFTGLKESGRNLGPAIPAADLSIETGSLKEVYKILSDAMHNKLHALYEDVMKKKNFKPEDVEAGREYVEAYVKYLHFVEPIYQMSADGPAHNSESHKH